MEPCARSPVFLATTHRRHSTPDRRARQAFLRRWGVMEGLRQGWRRFHS
jgi:hypothetical protein